jgi:mono/diheme cytochrome c family protein
VRPPSWPRSSFQAPGDRYYRRVAILDFGDIYSDAEIAAVANFVTPGFGAKGSQLTERDVTELRKQPSE